MPAMKKMLEWMSEYRFELGVLATILGIFASILAVFGGPKDYTPGFLVSIAEAIGDWHLWLWVVGPILLLLGVWYVYDTKKKRKEFEEMMDTTSRARFSQNLIEIEKLAWDLKRKDRIRVAEKKAELKIKKR